MSLLNDVQLRVSSLRECRGNRYIAFIRFSKGEVQGQKEKTPQRNSYSQISLASSATQKPLIIDPSFPLPSAEIRGEKESKILVLCLKGPSEEPEGLRTSHTP